ncbi:VTT domain-containing protein, partial [Patescibacteria group bacterium]|nr:VTT domain-containing protein [Patescibacteria group bacterium]MBU1754717.1 VTT domain-containing protein [Patescibacteria group bacterium]
TLSATIAFFIAKYFGSSVSAAFEKKSDKPNPFQAFIQKYKHELEKNGFQTVLFLRMVPLFPFDFVNYACGLTNIKYRTYLVATLIGVIPGLTAYIFLGSSLMNPYLLIPTVAAFIILSLLARYFKKRFALS